VTTTAQSPATDTGCVSAGDTGPVSPGDTGHVSAGDAGRSCGRDTGQHSGRSARRSALRPALRPALRVLRRDRLTIQVGTDPERAVAYAVHDPAVVDLVCSLDGRRTVDELAGRHGLDPAVVHRVIDELEAAGIVGDQRGGAPACCPTGHPGCDLDHPASGGRARSRSREVTESLRRLAPDLAAWDLLEARSGGGRSEWARRACSSVQVVGSGRLGLSIGLLLGAAGIGSISAGDTVTARQSDRGALALAGADVGASRHDGLRRRLAEVAPASLLAPAPPVDSVRARRASGQRAPAPRAAGQRAPDLVVLASASAAEREVAAELSLRGVPHLCVTVSETLAVLGPLVEPGRTACLRCLDLRRADLDPSWPLVLDRLETGPRAGHPATARARQSRGGDAPLDPESVVEASDDVLIALVAAHAVLQVTMYLRGQQPPTVDATVEFRLPSGLPRRRSWSRHPDCPCGIGAGAELGTARSTPMVRPAP